MRMPWCKLKKWILLAERRRQRRWKLEHESLFGAVIRAIGAAFGGGDKEEVRNEAQADPNVAARLEDLGFGSAVTYIDPGAH